jgi:hypothetical protein
MLWVATASTSYHECDENQQKGHAYQTGHPLIDGAHVFFACEGAAIGNNGEFITALATIALVASTILLWGATEEMAVISKQSLQDLERPWLLISSLNHGAPFLDKDPRIEFRVTNYGKQAAIITGIRGGSGVGPALTIDGIPQKEASNNRVGDTVAPGDFAVLAIPIKTPFNAQERQMLRSGTFKYITRGGLLYRGLTGQKCETGFCLLFERESDTLVRHGGEQYNYAK